MESASQHLLLDDSVMLNPGILWRRPGTWRRRVHIGTIVAFDGWIEDVRLWVWAGTTGNRLAKLTADRIAASEAIGVRWT